MVFFIGGSKDRRATAAPGGRVALGPGNVWPRPLQLFGFVIGGLEDHDAFAPGGARDPKPPCYWAFECPTPQARWPNGPRTTTTNPRAHFKGLGHTLSLLHEAVLLPRLHCLQHEALRKCQASGMDGLVCTFF